MSDFNYNNNGDKPPMQKSAMIVTVIVVAMIAMIFLGARSNNIPLIMGCFFAAFITVFVAAVIQGKKSGGAKSGINGAAVNTAQLNKYMPLLMDERTKQHPEVQVLLQYPAVQKAFFDPSSLSSPTIANDEHVRELFLVFDEMLAQGVISGNIYGNLPNPPQTSMQTGAMPTDPFQKMKEDEAKKKPMRKAGKIMRFVGIGLFLVPFLFVFIMSMSGSGSSFATAMLSFVITSACPMGMLLIIVGTIIGR